MIWVIIAVIAVLWVGRKFRPAHLGNDVLKFELFRHLHFRNARDAAEHMSYEDLEKKLWLQTTLGTVFVFASLSFSLKAMGLSWTSSALLSLCLALTCLAFFLKRSKIYRQTTLPLFATLCRMPQSRWDMRSRPRNWVRISPKHGRIWIRLPKDWHATKQHLKLIQELVNARVSGNWTMDVNARKFLITFRRESEPETILVSEPSEPQDSVEWEMEEKEFENGPW